MTWIAIDSLMPTAAVLAALLLSSTHARAIDQPGQPSSMVPFRDRATITSPCPLTPVERGQGEGEENLEVIFEPSLSQPESIMGTRVADLELDLSTVARPVDQGQPTDGRWARENPPPHGAWIAQQSEKYPASQAILVQEVPLPAASIVLRQPEWLTLLNGGAAGALARRESRPPPVRQPRPFPKPDGTTSDAARIPIEPLRQPVFLNGDANPVAEITRAEHLAQRATTRAEMAHVIELCTQVDTDPLQDKHSANPVVREYALRLAAWAANRRGEMAVDAGDENTGLADFNQAIEFDSSCWQAIHNRGVCHALRGDQAAALEDWNQVIELNPDCATAYRNRGELRLELGLAEAAIADYSRAIAKVPGQSELYHLRGFAEHRLGHDMAALRDYHRALQMDPRNVGALTDRGNVFAEWGYYSQAIKDYHAALRIDNRHTPAYRAAAWLLATCPNPHYRRPDKALVAARRAVVLAQHVDPLDFDVLAAAQASAGHFSAAVETQERAIELAGAQPVVDQLRERLAHYRAGKPFLYGSRPRIPVILHGR